MARLYSNENFPLPVVAALRELGHDVLTIQEAGRGDSAVPDHQVLEFAVAENRALLTLNRLRFIRLHGEVADHRGIIVCTFDPDFQAQAQRIHSKISVEGDLANKLVRVNRE